MIGDYHQPASESQDIDRLFQGGFQVFHLVVDHYPQRLKGLGGRVDFTPPNSCLLYQAGKLSGSLNRPFFNNVPGYPVAITVFPVCLDKISQSGFGGSIDNIGGGDPLFGIVTHIQRGIMLKAETTAVSV
jgi:hypothetical protein